MESSLKTINTIETLRKYNFTARKKYGQNFLIDNNIVQKIVDAAGLDKTDYVLEIGPGAGTLTWHLAKGAGAVTAVEIDQNLLPILNDTLSPYDNVEILSGDILKLDIADIIKGRSGGRPVKIVANLPYYITTPIIMHILESHINFKNITVMVQKEVAERMQAAAGSKDYGALSLAVLYYSRPEIIARVPASCFMPRPGVDSAVIRLEAREKPMLSPEDEELLFIVIRAAFNQRRKTLVNALANAPALGLAKESVKEILRELGLPEDVRGEKLNLERFIELSAHISARSAAK